MAAPSMRVPSVASASPSRSSTNSGPTDRGSSLGPRVDLGRSGVRSARSGHIPKGIAVGVPIRRHGRGWFAATALGVELVADEHRLRNGRPVHEGQPMNGKAAPGGPNEQRDDPSESFYASWRPTNRGALTRRIAAARTPTIGPEIMGVGGAWPGATPKATVRAKTDAPQMALSCRYVRRCPTEPLVRGAG
jgi:hypothetical protein